MKPLLLKPIPDYTIWGSNHLSTYRKIDKNYGTWWEVSAHPYCTNAILNLNENTTLQQLIDDDPQGMLGKSYTLHEMLRLAYLDTQDALSIQVHPEDEYALKTSNDFGKYESWYIIDAKPGATLVAGTLTSDKEVIKQALKDNTIEKYLQKIEVKKGDYIIIPSGMLHALGKDIWAIEIGTNSNTTYRFYDYNRKDHSGKTRTLHLKESFDVADFSLQPIIVQSDNQTRRIGDTPYFTVDEMFTKKEIQIETIDHYCILSNISVYDTTILWENERIILSAFDSAFIPASAKKITIEKGAHVLLSQPKKDN